MKRKRELTEREVTRKTGMRKVAEGLRDRQRGLDEEWKELYTWFAADDRSSGRSVSDSEGGVSCGKRIFPRLATESARRSCTPRPRPCERDAAGTVRLPAHTPIFWATGLRLSDREEYGFEALDLGNIAHQSLERFSRKADREKSELDRDVP